jgi:cholest-4-en-3-one 26-monooxygenase
MATTTAAVELGLDLTDRDLYRDGFPHERLSFLRDEPVWWHPVTPGVEELRPTGFYVVARHEVVRAVSRDPQRFTAYHGSSLGDVVPERRGESIVNSDPPVQSRFRRLVSIGFTPRMVARLDEMMEGWARRIVDSLAGRERCEFVTEVAELLPLHVIADIVGIPVDERPAIFDDVKSMLRSWDPESGVDPTENRDAQMRMLVYAHALSAARRDAPEDDVWSKLVHAQLTLDDGTTTELNEIELDLWFLILAIAGSETTRNAIAIGLKTLLERPDELERLQAHPELIDTAVDEIIRWTSPVLYHRRTVAADTEVAGVPVGAGLPITMFWPAANRDERVFDDPFRFDLERSPNDHVAFGGGGPHYCLGANLAKREVKVMLAELLARVDDLSLDDQPPGGEGVRWSVPGMAVPVGIGLDRLPVRYRVKG